MRNMKKRIIPVVVMLATLAVVSCGKERQCKCVYSDTTETTELLKLIVVDRQMRCEDITEMGYEVKVVTEDGQTLQRVEMHTVSCRDYGE